MGRTKDPPTADGASPAKAPTPFARWFLAIALFLLVLWFAFLLTMAIRSR
jgi:hypothetical protein